MKQRREIQVKVLEVQTEQLSQKARDLERLILTAALRKLNRDNKKTASFAGEENKGLT